MHKVFQPLGRGAVAFYVFKGFLLQRTLEIHPRQGMVGAVVGRGDAHQKGAVGVLARPRVVAHAVGHDAALLAGGGDDLAARAHTKGVNAPPCVGVHRELIVGGGEILGIVTVLRLVDQRLRMLDPCTDGKGLGLHRDALFQKQLEGVPRAVADG